MNESLTEIKAICHFQLVAARSEDDVVSRTGILKW